VSESTISTCDRPRLPGFGASILSTATSVALSAPISTASNSRPSVMSTVNFEPPSMTWLLVTMMP